MSVLVPYPDHPCNDKQDKKAYYPVEYSLGPIAIDFHHMEPRGLGVCHRAGVDVPV